MKNKKRETRKATPAPAAPALASLSPYWRYFAIGAFAAVVVVLWAYGPALNGPFLFDDNFLPFATSNIGAAPLTDWIHGQRPLLMASYWISARLSPDDTWWFHFLNVAIHCIGTAFLFFIVRKLLELAGVDESRRGMFAGLAAALFLLHPVQSEAVAYVAGRSDGLSAMLAFAAFTVFLYRKESAATWNTAIAVLLLFGAALASKEDTIALPALLLLTDLWWRQGSAWDAVRRNWKIYAPMVLIGIAGIMYLWPYITRASTAGFGLKEFTWYQYFFTQCRAVFVYLGLFLFPANLTLDRYFPISHTILEHGAIVGLIVLLALAIGAWMLRRRFPLACYGFFAFLILLAPTSSILPIKDPVAERRMYFAMFGLLLILVDFLSRLKIDRKALTIGAAAVLLLAAIVTHARAEVWSDQVAIWEDTAQKSPAAWRPHFQLAFAYYAAQKYDLADKEFAKTNELHPGDADVLLDWGLNDNSRNQPEQALQKLQQAAILHPSAHVFAQLGQTYGQLGKLPQAMNALQAAAKMDPNSADAYVYMGVVHFQSNELMAAVQDFRKALEVDPNNSKAREYLQTVIGRMRTEPAK